MAFPSIRGEPPTRFAIHIVVAESGRAGSPPLHHSQEKASVAARGSARYGDSVASVWRRHRRDRVMAGTPEHRDHECLHRRESCDEKKKRAQRSLRSARGSGDSERAINCWCSWNRFNNLTTLTRGAEYTPRWFDCPISGTSVHEWTRSLG
jgi:hypothetical protein